MDSKRGQKSAKKKREKMRVKLQGSRKLGGNGEWKASTPPSRRLLLRRRWPAGVRRMNNKEQNLVEKKFTGVVNGETGLGTKKKNYECAAQVWSQERKGGGDRNPLGRDLGIERKKATGAKTGWTKKNFQMGRKGELDC